MFIARTDIHGTSLPEWMDLVGSKFYELVLYPPDAGSPRVVIHQRQPLSPARVTTRNVNRNGSLV